MNLLPARLNGREVLLGVRPEHLEPCAESDAAFVASVDLFSPLGADTRVHGTVEGARIVARLHGTQRVSAGLLPLRFDPPHRHYFDAGSCPRIAPKRAGPYPGAARACSVASPAAPPS